MTKAWKLLLRLLLFLRIPFPATPIGKLEATRINTRFRSLNLSPNFTGTFDPAAHPALPDIQKRAAEALFQKLGVEWVPAEFWALLLRRPNPMDAFNVFCTEYRLVVERLRRKNSTELARLSQCIGIMLEIGLLPERNRETVRNHLRNGSYASAEDLLERARVILPTIDAIEALRGTIVFPAFDGFVEAVLVYRNDLFGLTLEDARNAMNTLEAFRMLQGNFDHLIESLDSLLACLAKNWPENDWGAENAPLRDGIVVTKEELERRLRTESRMDISAGIQNLQLLLEDLEAYIKEVGSDAGWKEPVDTAEAARQRELKKALDTFELEAIPPPDELKRLFRKLAMRYHPDRNPGDAEAEARFKDVCVANNIIKARAATAEERNDEREVR